MSNFTDPAILFFVFGILAGTLKSNLEIPQPISRFLSLYLLMALGLKGGFALAQSGLTPDVLVSLGAALGMAFFVPLIGYSVLRRFLSGFDAAAIAATYGSVSAVTFITASQYLNNHGVAFGGHMAAAMALMESPAIVFAVVMANQVRRRMPTRADVVGVGGADRAPPGSNPPLGKILHEALTDGAQLLLLGAMLIGWMSGETGQAAMKPFSVDLFKGMLAFFLLDMGLLAARNMGQLKGQSPWLVVYAVLGPLVHAGLAHLYFELIHPFEDGNGRIGRAIAEKALAMGAKHPLITSLSSTIERNKKAYYQALAHANGSLEVTDWLVYFSEEVLKAQIQVQKLILFTVEKARYFENFRDKLNDRQSKVAFRLFREGPEGFKGGLSAANYMRICTTSSATATRDLAEMVDLGALKKTGKLRHTRYYLPMAEILA